SAPGTFEPCSWASRSAAGRSWFMVRRSCRAMVQRANMVILSVGAVGAEAPGVLLVHGLAAHAERLGDPGPGPALVDRGPDRGRLQLVGVQAQGDHGGQGAPWVVVRVRSGERHDVNLD